MIKSVKYYETLTIVSVQEGDLLVALLILGRENMSALTIVRVMSRVDNEYFTCYDNVYRFFYVDLADEGQFYLKRLMECGPNTVQFGLETILKLTQKELDARKKVDS